MRTGLLPGFKSPGNQARCFGFVLLLSFVLLFAPVASQAEPSNGPQNEVTLTFAKSFANGHAFGFAQDRSLALFELTYGRQIWSYRRLRFIYLVNAVPIAIVSGPTITLPAGGAAPGSNRERTFGAGASPIGLEIRAGRFLRLEPFIRSSGGFLYFQRAVPVPDSTQFNFTVNIDTGVAVPISPRNALRFGYRYHHLSNANRGTHNPGIDTHMITAGFARRF